MQPHLTAENLRRHMASKPRRKPAPVVLTDTPQDVPVKQAGKLIRAARYVALAVPMGGTRQDLVDISKRMAAKVYRRMAERHDSIPLSEVFGSLIIGHFAGAC